MQFLGSKVVDRGTSDVELGCLLHSIGTKKWPKWRKRTPVTLGFVQKSFVITFNHHGEVDLWVLLHYKLSMLRLSESYDRLSHTQFLGHQIFVFIHASHICIRHSRQQHWCYGTVILCHRRLVYVTRGM